MNTTALPTNGFRWCIRGDRKVLEQKWVAHDPDTLEHHEEWRDVPTVVEVEAPARVTGQ